MLILVWDLALLNELQMMVETSFVILLHVDMIESQNICLLNDHLPHPKRALLVSDVVTREVNKIWPQYQVYEIHIWSLFWHSSLLCLKMINCSYEWMYMVCNNTQAPGVQSVIGIKVQSVPENIPNAITPPAAWTFGYCLKLQQNGESLD